MMRLTWIINDQMEMLARHCPGGIFDATNRSLSRDRLSEEVLSDVFDSFTAQFLLTIPQSERPGIDRVKSHADQGGNRGVVSPSR